MYREQWVADILGNRSVLCAALDVHMTACGSCERDPAEQSQDVRALREVVASWKNQGICDFDDLVLELIKSALREYDEGGRVKTTHATIHEPTGFIEWVNESGARVRVGVDRMKRVVAACEGIPDSHLYLVQSMSNWYRNPEDKTSGDRIALVEWCKKVCRDDGYVVFDPHEDE